MMGCIRWNGVIYYDTAIGSMTSVLGNLFFANWCFAAPVPVHVCVVDIKDHIHAVEGHGTNHVCRLKRAYNARHMGHDVRCMLHIIRWTHVYACQCATCCVSWTWTTACFAHLIYCSCAAVTGHIRLMTYRRGLQKLQQRIWWDLRSMHIGTQPFSSHAAALLRAFAQISHLHSFQEWSPVGVLEET